MNCKTECPYKDIGAKLKDTHADIIVVIDAEKTLLTTGDILSRLITYLVNSTNIDKNSIYFTSLYKCDDDSKITKTKLKKCLPIFKTEVEMLKPKYILSFGRQVTSTILGANYNYLSPVYSPELLTTVIPLFDGNIYTENQTMYEKTLAEIIKIIEEDKTAKRLPTKILLEEVDIINYLETLKTEPLVAFDVETTGLDPFSPDTKLLSIAFATKNVGVSFPIDLKYKGMPLVNKSRILSQLNNLFQNKDTIFVGHNLKFDIKMLKSLGGINFTSNFMDTMIGGYILDETAVSNRLEAWLPAIGVENHKGFDFENEEYKRGNFESMDDIVNLLTYNAKDSLATLYLNNYLLDNIPEEQLDTMITLIKLTRALVDIELNGIRVDVSKLQGIQQQLESELEEIHNRLLINPDVIGAAKKLGVEPKDINFNSSKQIGVIFEVGGYPIVETTPTGAIATGTQVLQTLINKYDIPFVKDLAEYRKKAKILEGFIKPYLTGDVIKADGRIHSTFHLTGTVTGRLSSSDPNLQQIPRGDTVKQLFIPEEGHYLVNLDYSQAELRVMAMLAEDPKLLNAYRQDIDVHKLTAALVYNIPLEEVTKEQRQTAKMVNFAIIYGSSAKGLAYRLGRPEEEMKMFIDRWYEVYSNVKRFVADVSNFAKQHGYVITPFGRRRHLPDVYSSNGALKSRALRQANNFIIQSTASDLTLKSIIQIHEFLKAHREYDARILSTVHDSIVLSINKDQVIELLKIFKSFVESYNYTWMKGIRMKADYSVGTNYANQTELEELSEAALQKALTEIKEDDNIGQRPPAKAGSL